MSTPANHDPALASKMRELSRAHFGLIWQHGKAGEPLSAEETIFYNTMREHGEYQDAWEMAGQLGDKEVEIQGVNPFLHIAMHSVVEQQLADRNPPETAQALFRLMQAGLDRHDAIHLIGSTLATILHESCTRKSAVGMPEYRRRLRHLKPE
jgi:hypothetical protein